jgi:hypothetical protein
MTSEVVRGIERETCGKVIILCIVERFNLSLRFFIIVETEGDCFFDLGVFNEVVHGGEFR